MRRDIAVEARVMGRVQGVAFRAWTCATARGLNLRGWVRNNVSGSVSAVLVGPKDTVEDMLKRLWDGPGAAVVRDVQITRLKKLPEVVNFEITR